MDAKEIIKQLEDALKEFGTYSFDDKGPSEVMDLSSIVADLNAQPVADVVKTLEVVSEASHRGSTLVSHILMDMQDIPDERWDALMSSETLLTCFES